MLNRGLSLSSRTGSGAGVRSSPGGPCTPYTTPTESGEWPFATASLHDLSLEASAQQIADIRDDVPRVLDACVGQRPASVLERSFVGDFRTPLEVAGRDEAEDQEPAGPPLRLSFGTIGRGRTWTDHSGRGRAAKQK